MAGTEGPSSPDPALANLHPPPCFFSKPWPSGCKRYRGGHGVWELVADPSASSCGPSLQILLPLGKAEAWMKKLKCEFKSQSWSKEAGDRVRRGGGMGTWGPRAPHGRYIAQGAPHHTGRAPRPRQGAHLPPRRRRMLVKCSLKAVH